MKNVCFFNSSTFWGGGEKLLLDHAVAFQQKGMNVHFVCNPNSTLHERATEHQLHVVDTYAKSSSFLNPVAAYTWARFFRKQHIDTVIFTTSHDAKLCGIAAHLAGIPNIVYLRGLAVEVSDSPLNKWLFGKAFTHIIVNSLATQQMVLKNLSELIDASRLRVIPHGIALVNSNELAPYDAVCEKANGIILGNAGRLTEQKGQTYLIEVAKLLKEKQVPFTLLIAGTGPIELELNRLIMQYELQQHVFLLGFVNDINAFIHQLDIFLMGSIWEGFGFVLAEAMALKKPIVAFDISSNPELVVHNETGFLVPFPDVHQFAERVAQLAADKSLRDTMGERGRTRVAKHFEINQQIDAVFNFISGK